MRRFGSVRGSWCARGAVERRWDELQRGEVGHEELKRAQREVAKVMAQVLAGHQGVERAEKAVVEAIRRQGEAEWKLEVGEDMDVLLRKMRRWKTTNTS